MDFPHPPLKLNTGHRWPTCLLDKTVIGLEINSQYCCAAEAKKPADSHVPTKISAFFDYETGEHRHRLPTVLLLDKEDPSRGWIGYEAESYALEENRTLYRDFLMVPDERSDMHYHNDPSQPTYRRLMSVFFYELLSEFYGCNCFLVLPDGLDWHRNLSFLEDFLSEVADRWNKNNPEEDHSHFFLLEPAGALEGFRLNEPGGSEDDPFALCKGLAFCGCLLQRREVLLVETVNMLQEAFPWAWARYRDTMYETVRFILMAKLDLTLSKWTEDNQVPLSFRKMISSIFCSSQFNTSALNLKESALRNHALCTTNDYLPCTGSDPQEDPDAFSGFPPIYMGPKCEYTQRLYYRLATMTGNDFLDFYPWVAHYSKEEPHHYAYLKPEQGPEIMNFFFAEIANYIPDESALFGSIKAFSLSFNGTLDQSLPSQKTKQELLNLITSRKQHLIKNINDKVYHDSKVWDALSRYLFQHIYDRQLLLLNNSLSFITIPTPPAPPEEGVLI